MDDFAQLDATAQAELVSSGQASPLELVDAAIARIEALNPTLNAVIHERFERARQEAAGELPDGPLCGVPFLLKDLDGTSAGDPYHAGSRFLRDHAYVSDHDSWLVARFREAGLVVVGRTNTPELGLVPTAEPEAYGPSRNPWDTTRSTGGSSGGSAAAVASGMVAVAHAGDGGGSIRIPASECGLVGLKPSRGRSSIGPDAGEAWAGLVSRLVVSRSVRDTAAVLDAVAGSAPGDPYAAAPPSRPYLDEVGADAGSLRIGFTSTWSAGPSAPPCVDAVTAAASLCESLGHRVDAAAPAALSEEASFDFITCFGVWTAAELDEFGRLVGTPVTADDVEPGTWTAAEMGRNVSGVQYLEALDGLHALSRRYATWWADPALGGDGFDVLMTPTIPELPPTLGQFGSTKEEPLSGLLRAAPIVAFTAPFNITGQPAISLPLHQSAEGLPVGVQLVAAAGREDLLLRLAAQLEQAAPWSERWPEVARQR